MAIIDEIRAYEPFNEQEEADKRVILQRLECDPSAFSREAIAHMACSIWVVSPDKRQTLLVYHNLYNSWSWIGGHADGEHDLARVALRELAEETGVRNARLLRCGGRGAARVDGARDEGGFVSALGAACAGGGAPGIFSLEVLTVDGHEKHGAYVSSHLHLNVTYAAVASPDEPIRVKPDENSGVKWVPLRDAVRLSTEPWIRERIYEKLIAKTALLDIPEFGNC